MEPWKKVLDNGFQWIRGHGARIPSDSKFMDVIPFQQIITLNNYIQGCFDL